MFEQLMRRKPIVHHDSLLIRTLTAFDLILMGIGAIIGAGVFVITGLVASTTAGPAVVLSYVLAGMAAMFAALAYAELASSISNAGSAYSYSYAGFGEFIAWIIGWNLILEYAMAVSTVAIGWAGYVTDFFEAMGIIIPKAIATNPFDGGVINLLAFSIIIILAGILSIGVRESSRFNAVIVFIKLFTIGLFLCAAIPNIKVSNWHPFMPFGVDGVIDGAALVFFAYIGFDALSTAVEETVDPKRSVPIGIIVSLIVCTLVYILVSASLTGISPYAELDQVSPVADAIIDLGYNKIGGFIAAGAIAGLTTVMLVMFYGLTRIIMSISRDGLLPESIAKIHPQTHTPVRIILITGFIMAVIAGLSPIHRAAELVNIGTLTAFSFVCAGVIVLRKSHPDLPRPFKLPLHPLFPILGVLTCLLLMFNLPWITWIRFFFWTLAGISTYFFYGYWHSHLRQN